MCVWLNVSVFAQRFRIAGNVQNTWISLHHFFRFAVQTAARRIDKNGFALIALQVDPLQAVKLTNAIHRPGKLFRRHANNLHIINMISGNIVLCGSDGRFGDFGCQHAVKIARQR